MFATTVINPFTNSSDANFRLWGSAISAQLLAAGLVQTADTGQINWVTVLAPAGTGVFQGYEIWRLNDSLQATAPVFIKIEFGEGSVTDSPAIRFQFGSGSNGSGGLTGVLSTLVTAMSAQTAGATTAYWSGAPGRFVMAAGTTNASTAALLYWSFERSKNASGNDTTEAILVTYKSSVTAGSASAFSQFAWDTATGMKSAIENSLSILVPSVGTGITGTQIGTYPVLHSKGIFMNPGMNVIGYFNSDMLALSVVGVPVYGTVHNYFLLGIGIVTNAVTRASSSVTLMIRYE